ncbi:helix-turn-helix transcriptional regulator [Bacillus sp. B15-48]|uniref:helix-turn-helix domain-containing protein n=1 Tax=Bacillus sp. B15-48 TaxID=1548601 RepID=UPI00193FD6D8
MEGTKLKELRKKNRLTLSKLSELTGISKSYLSLIERDIQKNPSFDILYRIAKTLNVELEELVKREKEGMEEIKLGSSQQTVKTMFKVEIEFTEEQMSPEKLQQIREVIYRLKHDE